MTDFNQNLEIVKSEIVKAVDERIKKYEEQNQNSAKGADESVKNELNNLTAKYSEVNESIQKLAKQADAIEMAQKNHLKNQKSLNLLESLEDSFAKGQADIDAIVQRRSKYATFNLESGQNEMFQKAVGTVGLSNVTGALPTSISPAYTTPNVRKQHIRGLLMNSPMTDATYSYVVITDKEGSVGIQTEGSSKSKVDHNVEFKTASPIVLAVAEDLSNQILQDVPRLQSYIVNRMVEMLLVKEDDEILNGAGGSNRFNGIITQATAYTPTGSANTSSADRFSYLLNAISKLAQLDYMPNGILINPYAYYEMLQVKTSTKEYTMPYAGVTFLNDTLRIAGVPVYQSTAVSANAFVVGDWSQAEYLTRQGLTVDFSTENNANFEKNLLTIRVEERVGLAVRKPGAFLTGSWTALAS